MPAITICDPELTVGMPPASPPAPAWTRCPLPGGLLRARLSPARRRHRRRGHAAGQGEPGARLQGRQRPRGARAHDVGGSPWAPPPSRRRWAPSTRCRIRWARSTTRTTGSPTPCSCPTCWSSTGRPSRTGSSACRAGSACADLRRLPRLGAGAARQIGIPHTLPELGVKESHLDEFAEMAAVDPTAGGNPVMAGVPRCADVRRGIGGQAVIQHRHPERSEAKPRGLFLSCFHMIRSRHCASLRSAPVGMTEA